MRHSIAATTMIEGSLNRHLYTSSSSDGDGDAYDVFVVEEKSSQEQLIPNEDVRRTIASFKIPERWCDVMGTHDSYRRKGIYLVYVIYNPDFYL